MDVYSAYQDQYLGTVVKVWCGPTSAIAASTAIGPPSLADPPLAGFAGVGEALGPAPTGLVGNRGPRQQSSVNRYATGSGVGPAAAPPDVLAFTVWASPLGFLRPLHVPAAAVRSVSMDRIILDRQRDAIPPSWWKLPWGAQ
jgi:hypothetical protein